MIGCLENIDIVMVNTTHPGNIGSAARAMKTMGLTNLVLVNPKQFPAEEASWLASGATDILDQATVTESLSQAIADCRLVIGTSARQRRIPWPLVDARQSAELALRESDKGRIALVFGREAMGLTNEELQLCHYHLNIAGNPDYDVLNVAMAIQIACYELRMCWQQTAEAASQQETQLQGGAQQLSQQMPLPTVRWDEDIATPQEMSGFIEHFEAMLIELDFLDPTNPRQIPTRLKRLFARVRMDKSELNLMRGMCTAVQAKLKASSTG